MALLCEIWGFGRVIVLRISHRSSSKACSFLTISRFLVLHPGACQGWQARLTILKIDILSLYRCIICIEYTLRRVVMDMANERND